MPLFKLKYHNGYVVDLKGTCFAEIYDADLGNNPYDLVYQEGAGTQLTKRLRDKIMEVINMTVHNPKSTFHIPTATYRFVQRCRFLEMRLKDAHSYTTPQIMVPVNLIRSLLWFVDERCRSMPDELDAITPQALLLHAVMARTSGNSMGAISICGSDMSWRPSTLGSEMSSYTMNVGAVYDLYCTLMGANTVKYAASTPLVYYSKYTQAIAGSVPVDLKSSLTGKTIEIPSTIGREFVDLGDWRYQKDANEVFYKALCTVCFDLYANLAERLVDAEEFYAMIMQANKELFNLTIRQETLLTQKHPACRINRNICALVLRDYKRVFGVDYE